MQFHVNILYRLKRGADDKWGGGKVRLKWENKIKKKFPFFIFLKMFARFLCFAVQKKLFGVKLKITINILLSYKLFILHIYVVILILKAF